MADSTSFSGIVHRCDPRKWPEIVAAVGEYVSGFDDGMLIEDAQWLILGEQFGSAAVNCGVADDLSSQLINIDPTIVFEIQEDPACDWLGAVAIYVGDPDMGRYFHAGDGNGNVVVNYEALRPTGILLSPESEDYDLRGHLDAQHEIQVLFGRYHYEQLEEIKNEGFKHQRALEAYLANPRLESHRGVELIHVDEDTTRGSDIRFAAFCNAADEYADYACGWKSDWFHADYYVDVAIQHNEGERNRDHHVDPGQLAYVAAEAAGRDHIIDELGGDHDGPVHDAAAQAGPQETVDGG